MARTRGGCKENGERARENERRKLEANVEQTIFGSPNREREKSNNKGQVPGPIVAKAAKSKKEYKRMERKKINR